MAYLKNFNCLEYFKANKHVKHLVTNEDTGHIVDMMEALIRKCENPKLLTSRFIQALYEGDYLKAFTHADYTDQLSFYFYLHFIYHQLLNKVKRS